MDTSVLKNFAQESRRYLMDVVAKKIEYYLTSDNVEIRAKKHLIDELKKEITNTSKDQVVEKIAYTWFNRFCALRYMDVKQYSLVGVLTPLNESHTQPEILMEAKSGHIKDELGNPSARDHVIGLLSGKVSSSDPQSEAYKHLVLMACNYYHSTMPFLFEKIDDYTELLMPDDLLSEASIISKVRASLTEENCKDVEVVGWLYQFYISEKKDEVFEGLKKNKKITPENIPAATQLFTPNWIVRYLVENSLGRLWMLNRPNSNLISKMEYYIKSESEEKDFLKIKGPEEIKVCDPACGSGHMLVYAFDLLYSMYEEVGIDSNEIPSLVLKNNLFGIEIDKRAGELAAFALTMKAREKQRRYFKNPVSPNICVLENIHFEESEIADYMDHVGHDLFSSKLRDTLKQFEEAKNFGSLIRPEVSDVENILNLLDQKNVSGHLFLTQTHTKVLKVLTQVKSLSPIYHVVIANPPYMGSGGMNGVLKKFGKDNFPTSKADLFAMFMERGFAFVVSKGLLAMVTMQNWMFLSSFEQLRASILEARSFKVFVQIGYNSFPEMNSKIAQACAFVAQSSVQSNPGVFINLNDAPQSADKEKVFFERLTSKKFFYVSSDDFKKISGSPIAYWVSSGVRKAFENGIPFRDVGNPRVGMQTANNSKFLRFWYEINANEFLGSSGENKKWIKYLKGGPFRKWYGNLEYLLLYNNDPEFILRQDNATILPLSRLNEPKCTWTDVTTGLFSCRWAPDDSFHDISGHCFYPSKEDQYYLLAFANSNLFNHFIGLVKSSMHCQVGDVGKMPLLPVSKSHSSALAREAVTIARNDWDSFETSWDFQKQPLIRIWEKATTMEKAWQEWEIQCNAAYSRMQELETENNKLCIAAYGLEREMQPEVQEEQITLTRADVRRDVAAFLSYAVGCMMGRYSLDRPGLILANAGDTFREFLKKVEIPQDELSFVPDEDGIVPMLESDWFKDDIVDRTREFIRVTFGEESLHENVKFIEESIGKDLRKYFSKDFYNEHVKMYKKRPIYWLFSSPNGTFNALVYLHRYTPDTVSIVLNSYLREFRTKLASKKENLERLSTSGDTSSRDKTFALKEIEQLKKMIVELDEYEKDVLYPLATQRLQIDLDDGVKVNYPKFGKALKPIKGLEENED